MGPGITPHPPGAGYRQDSNPTSVLVVLGALSWLMMVFPVVAANVVLGTCLMLSAKVLDVRTRHSPLPIPQTLGHALARWNLSVGFLVLLFPAAALLAMALLLGGCFLIQGVLLLVMAFPLHRSRGPPTLTLGAVCVAAGTLLWMAASLTGAWTLGAFSCLFMLVTATLWSNLQPPRSATPSGPRFLRPLPQPSRVPVPTP